MDRLIIGISGASGVQYGVWALELLQALPIETHLIMSKSAELTVHHELDCSVDDIKAVCLPILRHRIIPSFAARSEGMNSDSLIELLLEKIPSDEKLLSQTTG